MLEDRELCSVKEKEVYVQKLGLELQISMHTWQGVAKGEKNLSVLAHEVLVEHKTDANSQSWKLFFFGKCLIFSLFSYQEYKIFKFQTTIFVNYQINFNFSDSGTLPQCLQFRVGW